MVADDGAPPAAASDKLERRCLDPAGTLEVIGALEFARKTFPDVQDYSDSAKTSERLKDALNRLKDLDPASEPELWGDQATRVLDELRRTTRWKAGKLKSRHVGVSANVSSNIARYVVGFLIARRSESWSRDDWHDTPPDPPWSPTEIKCLESRMKWSSVARDIRRQPPRADPFEGPDIREELLKLIDQILAM